ncbi:hypothetical protein [Pyxidicoccus xibeiensis]|uniref:hypothetical protein n=1 Tax=Pyxidicoccus xibeiensis TaxID=2906759 RepID=UPI0020A6EC64|nr:hypothetical protein [Pyxidicoccus xibeiensis]MCP3139408.1 hypothetical protein [Pyxidicoccus xibeiensis]
MLVVREEQMRVLAAAQRQRFEDRCVRLILDEWAETHAGYTADEVRAEVRGLLEAGTVWGFHTERERYRLVNLGGLLCLGFQRVPARAWAVALLADTFVPVDERIEAVLAYAETRRAR